MKRIKAGLYSGFIKSIGKGFTLYLDSNTGLWRLKIDGHKTVLEAKQKKALLNQIHYMEFEKEGVTVC